MGILLAFEITVHLKISAFFQSIHAGTHSTIPVAVGKEKTKERMHFSRENGQITEFIAAQQYKW